jgi:hypothetical protein
MEWLCWKKRMLHRLVRVRTYAEGEEEKILLRGEEIGKVGKNRKKQIKNGYMEALQRILTKQDN